MMMVVLILLILIMGSKVVAVESESTHFPPMWSVFISRRRRHMWVEFVVGSLPCSERFFSGYSGFSSPQEPTGPNYNSIWNARTHLNEFLKSPSISWVNKYQFDRDGGDYDDDSGGDEDSDDNVDDGVMVVFNMPVRMMMMMMKMTMIMPTIMMVMLMILFINNGDNDDGNSVDDAGNDGDVDGHDVDDNDNDGGDVDDSGCQ